MIERAISYMEGELSAGKLATPKNIPAILSLMRAVLTMSGKICEVVQFVANRDSYEDSVYGTGVWSKLEKKAVPSAVAIEMAKTGVYAIVNGSRKGLESVNIPVPDEEAEQRMTNFVNQLEAMNDAQQLRSVAKDNFQGWEPDKRISSPHRIREEIKAHAIAYGNI